MTFTQSIERLKFISFHFHDDDDDDDDDAADDDFDEDGDDDECKDKKVIKKWIS